jgi:catechol 2,3-dioxygenase-like lactoylglutathione lyase family enzyme
VDAASWDWSLRIFDHVEVHASDFAESLRFYQTVLAPLGIPGLPDGPYLIGLYLAA